MPTLSFTVDAGQATRILHCLGIAMGLNRDATLQEAKDWLVHILRDAVKSVEDQQATLTLPPSQDLGAIN